MRKTAAAYHVTPQDLGFTEDVNRATSETQVDNQFRVADLPLIEHVQSIIDGFLQHDLGLPLAFEFDTGQEKEDRLATAQADKIYVEMGALGVSEVRERVYGLSEPSGQLVPRYIMTARSGPVPLSALLAVAGPIDEINGAPLPGAALPHKPFAPIEGVTPQKPPAEPPLAVVRYPAENQASAAAAVADANAAVIKQGEGAGITVTDGTVATSYDLIGTDDDDEEDGRDAVAKAAEMASFRRFVSARRKAGRWRDFEFTTVDPVAAHRLNTKARADVRKAAGNVVAAGLAVRAADTGRVLMLQRGWDPADPASGLWEFPGGCLETDETPLSAAVRECQEETGLLLPLDVLAGLMAGTFAAPAWVSADGVYEGYLATVDREAALSIGQRGQVTNPDDPDGDNVEAIAWWDPALLPGNPAIRPELAASLDAVLDAVAPKPVDAHDTVVDARFLTIDEVRAAAQDIVKGSGADPKARSWRDGDARTPQHAYDLTITDHYTPRVSEALQSAFPESLLRAAVTAVAGRVTKAADHERDALRAAARAALGSPDTDALERELRLMMSDAFAAGGHAAADQLASLGGALVTLDGVADIDWSVWVPGDPAAAALASNGGLAALLDNAGITVDGITGTLLDQLGNVIGDGCAAGSSVDEIAGSLSDIVSDPGRAEKIAHTETARAMTAATFDSYTANGVGQWEWVLSDGACPDCEDAASAGPFDTSDADADSPPLHPWCRCSASPVAASVDNTATDTVSDDLNDGDGDGLDDGGA